MEQKAKLDSASQITYPYDALQLNLNGICSADGSRGRAAILNVWTYSIGSHRTEYDLDRLIDEADQVKWNIIG